MIMPKVLLTCMQAFYNRGSINEVPFTQLAGQVLIQLHDGNPPGLVHHDSRIMCAEKSQTTIGYPYWYDQFATMTYKPNTTPYHTVWFGRLRRLLASSTSPSRHRSHRELLLFIENVYFGKTRSFDSENYRDFGFDRYEPIAKQYGVIIRLMPL